MIKIQTTRAEVLRYFFLLETGKNRYAGMKEEILSWRKGTDKEVICHAKQWFEERKNRGETNPTLLWTVGGRQSLVSEWVIADVSFSDIYSRGVNSTVNGDLRKVDWNVQCFAEDHGTSHKEFKQTEVPEEFRRLVVVKRSKEGAKGIYELIDGVHRAVAMALKGVPTVECYVANLVRD